MALLILALLQRIFLMSSLMLLLVWLIFFMVLIKLLPILGTISGKTVKDRKSGSAGMPRPTSYAVFCLKKKISFAAGVTSEAQAATVLPVSASSCLYLEYLYFPATFFFTFAATTEIYTLSLHDALPIYVVTDAASGVVDIFHGIDKAVADTWNNFWKDGKADGIGSNLSRK